MARLSLRKVCTGAGLLALAGAAWAYGGQPAVPSPMAGAPATGAPAAAQAPASAGAAVQPGASAKAHGAASGKAVAKPAPSAIEKPYWTQLSHPQQEALQPLAGEWDKLEGLNKKKWLEIANRFASMKPDEQQRVHDRMREWIKLTPEQRKMVRENYARAKKIEPARKSEQWELYQQLPEDQKKKLAAEAALKKQQAVPPPVARKDNKPLAPIKAGVATQPLVQPAARPGAQPATAPHNGAAAAMPGSAQAQAPNGAAHPAPAPGSTVPPGDAR